MAKEEYILLELPMPPTVNQLYAWMKRRHKSNEYKKWLQLADIEYIKNDINYKISWDNWLELHLNYFFSLYTLKDKKRIKDTANFEKATTDYLCTKIEGLEDHKIKRIIQEKHDSDKNIVKILIKEIPNK